MTWVCRCGEVFKTFQAAERHANAEHGAGRISIAVPARRVR